MDPGQDGRESAKRGQRWPRKWGDAAPGRVEFNFEAAVSLKGGEYSSLRASPFWKAGERGGAESEDGRGRAPAEFALLASVTAHVAHASAPGG
jgi:hypothetical protein